jgi:hypothetical protein
LPAGSRRKREPFVKTQGLRVAGSAVRARAEARSGQRLAQAEVGVG